MDTPRLPVQSVDTWTDLQGLSRLARSAREDSQAALPEVARQFESVFTQMLIKSMREASFGGGLLDSGQSDQWRDMFDQQLAVSLAGDGKGLGIATMLMRQLGGNNETAPTARVAQAAMPLDADMRAARTVAHKIAAPAKDALEGISATATEENTPSLLDRAVETAKTLGRTITNATAEWRAATPAEFVRSVAPHAQAAAEKLGVDVRAVLAQAALETGWGKHMPRTANGQHSFNLFGIKAGKSWTGARVHVPTLEFEQGVAVKRQAAFRAYEQPSQSFSDYAQLLGDNPRYAKALNKGKDIAGFARALHQAGYATDPSYASKLTAIANSDAMKEALVELEK